MLELLILVLLYLDLFPIGVRLKEICDKTVDNYAHALVFVPDWYKTQEMCDKVAGIYGIYLLNVNTVFS